LEERAMVDLIVIALLAFAIGAVVWAADKRHQHYGALLAPGVAVAAALVTWMVTVAAGLSYQPGWTWVPWIAALIAAAVSAAVICPLLGRRRAAQEIAELTRILRHRAAAARTERAADAGASDRTRGLRPRLR
jgi:4-amino-4-deoxy-L-arabinose transferase-like glycosyltransferase